MPQPTKGPRLGAGPAHQRLMLANLATSLFEHGPITTTEAKAKRLRPLAERLITFAKRGDLHARRQVMTVVRDKDVVHTLFAEIGPRFAAAAGWLHPDRQDRPAQGRQRADGGHLAGRGADRGAGGGRRGASGRGAPGSSLAAGPGTAGGAAGAAAARRSRRGGDGRRPTRARVRRGRGRRGRRRAPRSRCEAPSRAARGPSRGADDRGAPRTSRGERRRQLAEQLDADAVRRGRRTPPARPEHAVRRRARRSLRGRRARPCCRRRLRRPRPARARVRRRRLLRLGGAAGPADRAGRAGGGAGPGAARAGAADRGRPHRRRRARHRPGRARRPAGRRRATPGRRWCGGWPGCCRRTFACGRWRAAPAGFDARFSALWRRYAYRVTDAPAGADPLRRHDTLAWPRPLDLDAMRSAGGRAARRARLRRVLPAPGGRDHDPRPAAAGLGPGPGRRAGRHRPRGRLLPLDGAQPGRRAARGRRRPPPAGLAGRRCSARAARSGEVTVAPAHGLTLVEVATRRPRAGRPRHPDPPPPRAGLRVGGRLGSPRGQEMARRRVTTRRRPR